MKKYEIRFEYLKKFVAITHGKINISGGNIFNMRYIKQLKKVVSMRKYMKNILFP